MYPKIFADFRQSSFQSQTTRAVGKQVWFAPLQEQTAQSAPNLIVVDQEGMTVQYDDRLQRLSLSGSSGWVKERDGGLNVFAYNGETYYRASDGFLHATNAVGKERLDEFFIPRSYARGGVQLVVPLGKDHFLMQTFNKPEEVELGIPPGKDNFHLFIKGPESYKDIDWSVEYEGIALPGLITTDGMKIIVLDQANRIMTFDITTGKQLSSVEIKGAGFVRASLDQADNIIAYCWDAEDKKKLCSYTLQGVLNWEFLLGGRDTRVAAQPPALTTDGNVLIIVDSLLLSLSGGNKLWERPVPPAAMQYITVLGDNSILITAANEMTHLDDQGQNQFVFRLPAGEVITTPAVLDDKGKIYFGSTKGIYCIN
jgi:outer membrane protein assembly factor BamB